MILTYTSIEWNIVTTGYGNHIRAETGITAGSPCPAWRAEPWFPARGGLGVLQKL
jgi:hypothetical protein